MTKYIIDTQLQTAELQEMIKAEIARKNRIREKYKNNQIIYEHLTAIVKQLGELVFTSTK